MNRQRLSAAALGLALVTLLSVGPLLAEAQEIGYFGKNRLVFEPAGPFADDNGKGKGIIDFRGGEEPNSRWRATFRFSRLDPNVTYSVVILGRSGAEGSEEAGHRSPLCAFDAKDNGKGSCFWYFSGLARLNVVQLRLGDENGPLVMQASRDGNLGSIETVPNRYSPGGAISESKQSDRKSGHGKHRRADTA
jgi:hypothetical protein